MDIPLNIGIIPDGTRRWAKNQSIPLFDAYWKAMLNIATIVDYFYMKGAVNVSVYLLSKQNLERKPSDLEPVITCETKLLQELIPLLLNKWQMNIFIAGCLAHVPNKLAEAARLISESSCHILSKKKLYLLIGYDPQDEISHANSISSATSDFFYNLWVPQKLDIVIRTSGEFRLSNFLPLQSGYAEIFFLDKHFNEITLPDIENVFLEYQDRMRRFGK